MKKIFIGLLATILINSRIKNTKSLITKSPFPHDNPIIVKIGKETKLQRLKSDDYLHVIGPCADFKGYFLNFRNRWYLTDFDKRKHRDNLLVA